MLGSHKKVQFLFNPFYMVWSRLFFDTTAITELSGVFGRIFVVEGLRASTATLLSFDGSSVSLLHLIVLVYLFEYYVVKVVLYKIQCRQRVD